MKERPILFSAPMVRALLAGTKTQTRRVVKPQPSNYAGGVNPHNTGKSNLAQASYFDAYCNAKRTEANPRRMSEHWCWWTPDHRQGPDWIRCPYGVPGDVLWVKETWADVNLEGGPGLAYRANNDINDLMDRAEFLDERGAFNYDHPALEFGKNGLRFSVWSSDLIGGLEGAWRSPLHMKRWMSRIALRITEIRVERLNDISEADAIAEGVEEPSLVPILGAFWSSRDGYAKLWQHINGAGSWAANPWVWVVTFERVQP